MPDSLIGPDTEEHRKIDVLVAEQVFGMEVVTIGGDYRYRYKGLHGATWTSTVPSFTRLIDATWDVVARMREHPNPRYRTLRLTAYPYRRTYATFDAENEDDWTEANGEFATQEAICLAALAASIKEAE